MLPAARGASAAARRESRSMNYPLPYLSIPHVWPPGQPLTTGLVQPTVVRACRSNKKKNNQISVESRRPTYESEVEFSK